MLVAIGINGVSVKGSIGWKFEYTNNVDCVVQMISTEDFLKNEGINFINPVIP